MNALKAKFLTSKNFAVVGASTNPEKFGYKVLNWYINHKMNVYPIHPKEKQICNIPCHTNISSLLDELALDNKLQNEKPFLSVSIITPPKITLSVLEEIKKNLTEKDTLKDKEVVCWIQPGAENEDCKEYTSSNGIDTVYGCVLKDGDGVLETINGSKI
ncbi:NAD(P)-binding protein [Neocallimastix lanati (nom. inval.)]|jgi:predicted CoA-binding protein|uniref:NAD(P)-binding protein n=1 Tax=Neocallimastix californiae TaxID=1754190 RepID=A0A1Y2F8E9_9FUNG|nr:NAD(P)-binding protein [Neocallimastix sp. JGI-2020a]ORY80171.1 NAD(P)-binding protein [Neocallimastix californiae]|eukprot:ORY80171.1 NAD(P)-binding protein [Neocallimastix californiae]